MISFYGKITEFYSYRSGRLTNVQMIIDELTDKDKKILSRFLKKNGYELDNHICFKLANGMSIMFSDNKLLIGSEDIRKEYW